MDKLDCDGNEMSTKPKDRRDIRIGTFLAMCMVVMIHSPVSGGGEGISGSVIHCITQWAVPYFFFVSGCFLMRSMQRSTATEMCRKKIKSLLVPFLLWELIWSFVGGNPTLWFLQSLIAFTALALGVWAVLGRRNEKVSLVFLGAVFAMLVLGKQRWAYGTPTSPFFFLAGLFLSERVLNGNGCRRGRLAILSLIAVVVLRTVWGVCNLSGWVEMSVRNVCVIFEIAFVWFAIELLPSSINFDRPIFRCTFFVYCFHYPVLCLVKQGWVAVFGQSFVSSTIGFFVLSLTMPFVCCLVALGVRSLWPFGYRVISGGR